MVEQDFLDAIRESPDDRNLKLVYADWLDQQGDGRGEMIRLACQLSRLVDEADLSVEFLRMLRMAWQRHFAMNSGDSIRMEIDGVRVLGVLTAYNVDPPPVVEHWDRDRVEYVREGNEQLHLTFEMIRS